MRELSATEKAKIYKGRMVGLAYRFSISEEGMEKIRKGDFFTFAIPGNQYFEKVDESDREMEISLTNENGETENGTFAPYSILSEEDKRTVRVSFERNFTSFKPIEDGKLEV